MKGIVLFNFNHSSLFVFGNTCEGCISNCRFPHSRTLNPLEGKSTRHDKLKCTPCEITFANTDFE